MTATFSDFTVALNHLVSIEPAPEDVEDMAEYNALMAPHAATIASARQTIRDYGLFIAPKGLAYMRGQLSKVVAEQSDGLAVSVITSTVNHVWDGCGDWQA